MVVMSNVLNTKLSIILTEFKKRNGKTESFKLNFDFSARFFIMVYNLKYRI